MNQHYNTATDHGSREQSPDFAHAVAVGYEPKDMASDGVFIFLISLAVICVIVIGVVWVFMMGFVEFDRSGDPIATPVSIEPATVPEPLQPSWNHNSFDREDMASMNEETHRILTSSDTSPTGRHYIDIKSAMTKVLPLLPQHAADSSGGGTQ